MYVNKSVIAPEDPKPSWWSRWQAFVVTAILLMISAQLLDLGSSLRDMQRSAHTHSPAATDITGVPTMPPYVKPITVQDPSLWGFKATPFSPMSGGGQVILGSYTSEQRVKEAHEAFKAHIQECWTRYSNTGLFCTPELLENTRTTYAKERARWVLYASRLDAVQIAGLCSYLWQPDDAYIGKEYEVTPEPGFHPDGSFIRWAHYPNGCEANDYMVYGVLPTRSAEVPQ